MLRRSNPLHQAIVDATKNKHDQELPLPSAAMCVLRAHVEALPPGPMRDSDLIFPAIHSGMRTRSVTRQAVSARAQGAGLETAANAEGHAPDVLQPRAPGPDRQRRQARDRRASDRAHEMDILYCAGRGEALGGR